MGGIQKIAALICMHGLLQKLLFKRGIGSVDQLTPEEKSTFEGYEKILSKKELTIDDLRKFLQGQLILIEAKWKDYSYKDKADLIPYFTVYKTILEALDAPEADRKALEQYLIGQIK